MKIHQKGIAHIFLLILIFVGALILFSPIPYYVPGNQIRCFLAKGCPRSGWNLGPSLFSRLTNQSETQNENASNTLVTNSINKIDISEWETYVNEKLTIKYPQTHTLLQNQIVSVDGEKIDKNNTLTILKYDGTYSIEIYFSPIDRISCEYLTYADPSKVYISGIESNRFINTPCGPLGGTLITSIDQKNYFQIFIESNISYFEIEDEVMKILSTFDLSE